VSGNVIPGTLNSEPETLILEITRLFVPVFVTATLFVLVVPTLAFPKESEAGELLAETVDPDEF